MAQIVLESSISSMDSVVASPNESFSSPLSNTSFCSPPRAQKSLCPPERADTYLDILVEAMLEQGRDHRGVTMLQGVALWRANEKWRLSVAADHCTVVKPKQKLPAAAPHPPLRHASTLPSSRFAEIRANTSHFSTPVEPALNAPLPQRRMTQPNLSALKTTPNVAARFIPKIAGFGAAVKESPNLSRAASARFPERSDRSFRQAGSPRKELRKKETTLQRAGTARNMSSLMSRPSVVPRGSTPRGTGVSGTAKHPVPRRDSAIVRDTTAAPAPLIATATPRRMVKSSSVYTRQKDPCRSQVLERRGSAMGARCQSFTGSSKFAGHTMVA